MVPDIDFKPYDQVCFDRLAERFQYLFEPELINEICRFGVMRKYQADHTIIDIGHIVWIVNSILRAALFSGCASRLRFRRFSGEFYLLGGIGY